MSYLFEGPINSIKSEWEDMLTFLDGRIIMFHFSIIENNNAAHNNYEQLNMSVYNDFCIYGFRTVHTFYLAGNTLVFKKSRGGTEISVKSANIIDDVLQELLDVLIKHQEESVKDNSKEFLFSFGGTRTREMFSKKLGNKTLQLFSQINLYGVSGRIFDPIQIKKQFKIYGGPFTEEFVQNYESLIRKEDAEDTIHCARKRSRILIFI